MIIVISIILGTFFLISLIINILLYKAGERQMNRAGTYEEMYQDIVLKTKDRIMETYIQMKQLDNNEMFSKDDDVGVSFKQLLRILQELNEITQEQGE